MADSGAVNGIHSSAHVWFVNHHTVIPSKDSSAARHMNMARYMQEHGWSSSLIVASTRHSDGGQAMPGLRLRRITDEDGIPALWVRANAYGRSMLLRFVGMVMFTIVALLPGVTRGLQRPNVVVGSTVHPLAAWVGLRLAKRNRVPFVYEIRDVWPDALVHLGKVSSESWIARSMRRLSRHLARQAVLVISPLPNVDLYLAENGIDTAKFRWVSNGFDGSFDPAYSQPSETGTFTFMYLGAHGNANALDGILEAFDQLCTDHPTVDFRLRLVGDGPLKPQLVELAHTMPSANRISFENRIPQSEVTRRAREADCLVANLHDSPVYRYGISPNKLFGYLYAGRPVVFGCSAPNNPIREANAGIVVGGDDRPALAAAMYEVYAMGADARKALADNGHAYVVAEYTHTVLAAKLAAALDEAGAPEHNRPRVVHVSSVHPFTDNRIHYRECATLATEGYDVTLVAVESSVVGPVSNVKVITIPPRPRARRLLVSTCQATYLALRTRARIVHLHDPELIPFIPVLRLMRRSVVYDAHEDLPTQVLSKSYLSRTGALFLRQVSKLLLQITRAANLAVAATDAIRQALPAGRTVLVHNYPPLRTEEEEASRVDINTRDSKIVYVGGISPKRGATVMVDALMEPSMPEGWGLSLAGTASRALLEDLHHRPGWDKVDYLGQVGPDSARDLILGSRVGLVLFADSAAHRDALPTKMFEYLAAGVPVIASDFPLWRTIVLEHECGILVDPSSPAEVAAAVRRYADDPEMLAAHSRNARSLAVEKLNWRPEGERLVRAYEQILAR